MSISFGVAKVEGLPERDWTTAQQARFGEDDDPVTSIHQLTYCAVEGIREYQVIHESRRQMNGRVHRQEFKSVIAREQFPLYFETSTMMAYSCAPRAVWHDAMDRIQRDDDTDFRWYARTLNLGVVGRELASQVRGAWFAQMKMYRVNTAGLFSPQVGTSDEYQRFEALGRLSALILDWTLDGRDFKVQVSADATMLLYEELEGTDNLGAVRSIMTDLEGIPGVVDDSAP